MDPYEIHLCLKSELKELQRFIQNHWKKNHVLAVSDELMRWQYYDSRSERYNFFLATHKASGEIHGILGFIPLSHFDRSIRSRDVWSALWKVRDDIKAPGLGVTIYYHLLKVKNPRSFSTFGLRRELLPLYKNLGF